ncbi:Uncharacterised protein [Actinobacillus pleuropneumoniae]|nr:Uncharacterised protein [Actinobacillus pleuropneumoniae]
MGRLEQIWRYQIGAREKEFQHRFRIFRLQHFIRAFADHHRIDDDPFQIIAVDILGNELDDLYGSEHAGLHRIDADALEHGFQLRFNDIQCYRENLVIPCFWFHAHNRGQCGHSVYVKFLKGFQIGLDASAAACIRAGYG